VGHRLARRPEDDVSTAPLSTPHGSLLQDGFRDPTWPEGFVWSEAEGRPVFKPNGSLCDARDDADYVLRWLRQSGAPENIVRLQLRALESLGGCGCDYELVEDGAVQRVRWFHEPGCPRG